MLRICHWKMLDLIFLEYENMYKFIPKGVAVQQGVASQQPLITGRNVKDLSPEKCLLQIDLVRKFTPKGMAVQLPPNNKYKC